MSQLGGTQQEIWKKYIRGELGPDQTEALDALLREDDALFQSYMQTLMAIEEQLPVPPESPDVFADRVLSAIREPSESMTKTSRPARKRWNQPAVHYVLAASITLLLLGGGVFDLLSAGAGAVAERQNTDPSLSERLMERAAKWMDRHNAEEPLKDMRKDGAQ